MAKLWLTYAWLDNQDSDVDFIAQELNRGNIAVRLDKWDLQAGTRLWEQIAHFISSPDECDAWGIYLTQNSIASQACREELAMALDRCLRTRGAAFPLIGIFPSDINAELIPVPIRTRLYVSLLDPEWKERVVAAVEGRSLSASRVEVLPFHIKIHDLSDDWGDLKFSIEMRPRGGVWSPFAVMIPLSERGTVAPSLTHGPSNYPPLNVMLWNRSEGDNSDDQWYFISATNQATPTQSYYLHCRSLPSKIAFGQVGEPMNVMEWQNP